MEGVLPAVIAVIFVAGVIAIVALTISRRRASGAQGRASGTPPDDRLDPTRGGDARRAATESERLGNREP